MLMLNHTSSIQNPPKTCQPNLCQQAQTDSFWLLTAYGCHRDRWDSRDSHFSDTCQREDIMCGITLPPKNIISTIIHSLSRQALMQRSITSSCASQYTCVCEYFTIMDVVSCFTEILHQEFVIARLFSSFQFSLRLILQFCFLLWIIDSYFVQKRPFKDVN